MTVFVCNGNPDKPRESYFVNNPDIITNQTGIDSEKPEARGKGVDNETETSTKPFWFVMISTYLMLLALTIFVIGTIAYGHVLTKTTSNTCSCAENTEEINFRFELLEKKFETLESSFLQIVDSNTRKENTHPRNKRSTDSRSKRQIERQLIQDGVPIVLNQGDVSGDESDAENDRKNTEGLRIYDSWYQSSNSIPISSRGGRNIDDGSGAKIPIKPHHRKSAAWVEEKKKRRKRKKHNLNPHFDENSVYRRGRGGSGTKADHLKFARRSRVSITATESSYVVPVVKPKTTKAPSNDMSRRAMNNRAAVRSLDRANQRSHHHSNKRKKHHGKSRQLGIHHQVSSSSSSHVSNSLPLVESVNIIPNERRPKLKSGGSHSRDGPIKDQFNGLKSTHFVGKMDSNTVGGSYRNPEEDGKFKNWQLARWAKKMRLEDEFPISNGTVRIKEPGVYYIYAQINYLDEHDVNAFQILHNDDPFLLCTTMTNTGRSHTISKANTCYTGGVSFLEAEDEISIRDLEVGRHSVIRPAHTFFGLIQLSGLNP